MPTQGWEAVRQWSLLGQYTQTGNQTVRCGQYVDQVAMPAPSGPSADSHLAGGPQQSQHDQCGHGEDGCGQQVAGRGRIEAWLTRLAGGGVGERDAGAERGQYG